MAHGLNPVLRRPKEGKGAGSRRIFAPHFKLQVLDSYRNDADCRGNQRATARKYGIHRRQIQKWLQCERSLRDSVGKRVPEGRPREVVALGGAPRQRGDAAPGACAQAEARAPPRPDARDRSPSALGQEQEQKPFLSPSQDTYPPQPVPEPSRVPALGAPLDYTVRSRSPLDPGAPIDLSLKRAPSGDAAPVCLSPFPQLPSPPLPPTDPDVWDLSVRGQKRSLEASPAPETQPRPVKLFKPYLDEPEEDKKAEVVPPCCNRYVPAMPEGELQYYNNNHLTPEYSYTLHELQPKGAISYYYPYPECEMPFCGPYDVLQTSPPLKQRQSYSLDFKLSAIECYYQDTLCRGSQRAVASKYNVHRRQVQKWLKQEDELRSRSDATKLSVR